MATEARSTQTPPSAGPPERAKCAVLQEYYFVYLLLFSFIPEALGKAVASPGKVARIRANTDRGVSLARRVLNGTPKFLQ